MPVRLVVPRIEERARVARGRGDDRACGYDPEAHDLTAARLGVTRMLHRRLGGGGVDAPRVLVRGALTFLRKYFPEIPLRLGSAGRTAGRGIGVVGHSLGSR